VGNYLRKEGRLFAGDCIIYGKIMDGRDI